ncbi:MAG: RnfABCDGE type electron transport complex subunit G [Tannerellaceae bacterium]|jgi:electron transport complex protein RnfG|nr:RnfABCDGE type electron transport complex subunit G [Tannerellaceae bacterium]
MEKLKSTFPNMCLSLTLIGACAGALLAVANHYTAIPIAKAKIIALENALKEVSPAYDNDPIAEAFFVSSPEGDSLRIYPARRGDDFVGVAVETSSRNGFSGEIRILVGFDTEGTIINYSVLEHAETPGLGAKMQEWFRMDIARRNILGRKAGKLAVTKDGGDVDAITASTITSRAFLHSINRAYHAYRTPN